MIYCQPGQIENCRVINKETDSNDFACFFLQNRYCQLLFGNNERWYYFCVQMMEVMFLHIKGVSPEMRANPPLEVFGSL